MSEYTLKPLSNKERKQLARQAEALCEEVDELLPKKGQLYRASFGKDQSLIILNRQHTVFLELDDLLIPSLNVAKRLTLKIPKITVDIGAIKFVTNGADIMRPGITKVDDAVIEQGLVVVVEESKQSPIAFGISLYDAVDLRAKSSGKCIKNIHYIKDQWFNFSMA